MAENRIGYSVVRLADGAEIAWNVSLPWLVEYPNGRVMLDKVGERLPDRDRALYQVVERWQLDEAPADNVQTGYTEPQYDGTRVTVRGVYEPIDPAVLAERARVDDILNDTEGLALLNQLRTATVQQIKNYITANVTDLASARAMLIKIVVILARLV